ncbi:MAG: glycosyltransferase family 2 protein [Candidatus Omnitrophica bacterium]|nr:glycosyltransferase family 2 protein [Candidatus Omnitrophota bacterium]
MNTPLLSVIVPVFNEAKTIRVILERISAVEGIEKEIIVVDDGSTDGTDRLLKDLSNKSVRIIYHSSQRGKGAAFLTGLDNAQGELVIIQDADFEYDPNDFSKLIQAYKQQNADLVFGARFINGHDGLFLHRLGNKVLTMVLNVLFGSKLNDYATCYKLASRSTFIELGLKASGFDIDVEIVCNALKKKKRIVELPVAYFPRTYKDGKKIRWRDGIWALFYMIKYRLLR